MANSENFQADRRLSSKLQKSSLNESSMNICAVTSPLFPVQGILKRGILDIESIISEHKEKTTAPVLHTLLQNIQLEFKKLKRNGLVGYGLSPDSILVFVKNFPDDSEVYAKLTSEIKQITSPLPQQVHIYRTADPIFKPLISNGDKIIPNKEAAQVYGTLGTFAKSTKGDFVALTGRHVAEKDKIVYVSPQQQLGVCVVNARHSEQTSSDLAVIKINDNIHENCNKYFKNEDEQECSSKLFRGTFSEILNKRVYKKGATTRVTRGVIRSVFNYLEGDDHKHVLIEGLHGPFAEGGDSGSVVFMYDANDHEHNNIIVTSMIVGGDIQVTDKEDKDKVQNIALSFMLHKEFDGLKSVIDLELIRKEPQREILYSRDPYNY